MADLLVVLVTGFVVIAAATVVGPRLGMAAQHEALLEARDNGLFDDDVLADALTYLDASEIAIELRSRHVD